MRHILIIKHSRSENYTSALEEKIQSSTQLELTIREHPNGDIRDLHPDILLVTTDRREVMPHILEAFYRNIPIIQLFAGAVGEATHDDLARHAITRMAYVLWL